MSDMRVPLPQHVLLQATENLVQAGACLGVSFPVGFILCTALLVWL